MTYFAKIAERSSAMSSVNLGGFLLQLETSFVSSHTEELWYKKKNSLSVDDYIFI